MFLSLGLSESSIEERLHLYNLLHPVHRLIDFWCGHPDQPNPVKPVSEWELEDWQNAQVHLHPQLMQPRIKEELLSCVNQQKPFAISLYIPVASGNPIVLESDIAACCLLPLWDGAKPVRTLVDRWLKVRPHDPVTLQPISAETAFNQVKELLSKLEVFLYVLVEQI